MDNGSIEIKINIPADRIVDLLDAAYHGGIGYWCRVMDFENGPSARSTTSRGATRATTSTCSIRRLSDAVDDAIHGE